MRLKCRWSTSGGARFGGSPHIDGDRTSSGLSRGAVEIWVRAMESLREASRAGTGFEADFDEGGVGQCFLDAGRGVAGMRSQMPRFNIGAVRKAAPSHTRI
jgi:hypothetical protein